MMKVGATGDELLMVSAIVHCIQVIYGDEDGVKDLVLRPS